MVQRLIIRLSQALKASSAIAVFLYEHQLRRSLHGKTRSMFKAAHCKEPLPRTRSTAGWNIDSVGTNSPMRMWCACRGSMVTGRRVDSNPSRSVRSNAVSRKKGAGSEAGQRSPTGRALSARILVRVLALRVAVGFQPIQSRSHFQVPSFERSVGDGTKQSPCLARAPLRLHNSPYTDSVCSTGHIPPSRFRFSARKAPKPAKQASTL